MVKIFQKTVGRGALAWFHDILIYDVKLVEY
jgi:hypothetical protein